MTNKENPNFNDKENNNLKSLEDKLNTFKIDQKNIEENLLKYFGIKIEDINKKREFFKEQDTKDSEDLISRYKKLIQKINEYKEKIKNLKMLLN